MLTYLETFDISLPLEEIGRIPKELCKSCIKKKSLKLALKFSNTNQGSKSTMKKELKMSPYLSANNEGISLNTAFFIAKTQTHMIENIKGNFKEYYKPNLSCNSCNKSECDQKHLLECPESIGKN